MSTVAAIPAITVSSNPRSFGSTEPAVKCLETMSVGVAIISPLIQGGRRVARPDRSGDRHALVFQGLAQESQDQLIGAERLRDVRDTGLEGVMLADASKFEA